MEDDELRSLGLKVTLPRLKVLKVLETSKQQHMSAEAIYKALIAEGEEIALATVYRVLTQFEEAGLLKRHNFEGGSSVFEIDQGDHHDHLVCLKCNQVVEFHDELIESQQIEVAQKLEFSITDHSHTIYGMCKACQGEENMS